MMHRAGIALALLAAWADGPLEVREESYGFALIRPDESWVVTRAQDTADVDFVLSLYPRGSTGVPGFVIYVAALDAAAVAPTAEDVRAGAIAALEAQNGTLVTTSESAIAGLAALSLHGRMHGSDQNEYDIALDYLVEQGHVYALQRVWPTGDDAARDSLDPLRVSFSLFAPRPVVPEDPRRERWRELAGRCGSELDWAEDWPAAAERAREGGKLVLVVFEHYTVLDLPRTAASGVLMDADFQALVQERLVPLRLEIGDAAPFRDPAVYGMSASSWGSTLLFVSPQGEVLADVGHGDGLFVADVARGLLQEQGHVAGDRLERATLHLRRGELDEAEKLLERTDSARGHRLRATLFRQRRQAQAAIDELRDAGRDADVAVELALMHLRAGHWMVAQSSFDRALEEYPDGARAAEARWWLGALEVLQQGVEAGGARWRLLAEEQPESRWAWKAAANLLGTGAFVNGVERLDWPDASSLATVDRRPGLEPLAPRQLVRAEEGAVTFLLDAQREDGSWPCPFDVFASGPTGYTYAITALCGSSLLLFGEEQAAGRALDYLLAVQREGLLAGGTDLMGVYSIWARAFVLRFLAQARVADLGSADEMQRVMQVLLVSVLDSQHRNGGWPYVVLADDPQGTGFDPSSSFLTAGVVQALLDARAAGVAVPQEALDAALRFLLRCRRPDGGFLYFPDTPDVPTERPESAGRGPVCALALLRGGAGDLDALRDTLATFLEQRAHLASEWGKDLCHTGLQGQGAHYLFYDYAFAAAAVAELPEAERGPYRDALLEDVLAARDEDGAFTDMPSLGRAYGTAMALFLFERLR